MKRKVKILNKL